MIKHEIKNCNLKWFIMQTYQTIELKETQWHNKFKNEFFVFFLFSYFVLLFLFSFFSLFFFVSFLKINKCELNYLALEISSSVISSTSICYISQSNTPMWLAHNVLHTREKSYEAFVSSFSNETQLNSCDNTYLIYYYSIF